MNVQLPLVCITIFLSQLSPTTCLDNGLGLTPQMGYNTWYDMGCSITEDLVRATADKFIALGLDKYGYEYLNLDDCWAGGRYSNGTVYADNSSFNSPSLSPLASYIHGKNLKFGVYTDRGTKTCAGRPGAQGYEEIDANTYASWGVDYLKEDSCNVINSNNVTLAYTQYSKMRDSLSNTSRDIFFSLCGWNNWYAPIGLNLGNSWRIGPDDTNWNGILTNIDINSDLYSYSGPGGWNDPCLLLGEDINGDLLVTTQQTRAQFSMWAIMSSPLLISVNIRNMSEMNFETFTNKYVIAVNQDKAGKQGQRIVGSSLTNYKQLVLKNENNYKYNSNDIIIDSQGYNIWSKELIDGSRAFVFLNSGSNTINLTCDAQCFNNSGIVNINVKIYDLWNENAMVTQINTNQGFTVTNLEPSGGVAMYKMTPAY